MSDSPEALLLVGSGCPHCAAVRQALETLRASGEIAALTVVNASERPELARQYGVRSVPWLRLGPFELQGQRSLTELRAWLAHAGTREGMAAYFGELLASGRLAQVEAILRRDPAQFAALFDLLADPDTELQVRIGVGAVVEAFAGDPARQAWTPRLCELSRHHDPRVRLDAVYYLGLGGAAEAADCLHQRLQDTDPEVREEAAEALKAIGA